MSCELKNIKDPCQIQCSFPEVANGKGDFAVYLNSFDGPADLVVSCTYNGRYACVPDEVFVTYENLNKATITVTEAFANKNGTFSCQRGDIPMTNTCQVPFTENAHPISNFKVDRAIAHGVSTLKPQQFEEGNASSAAIIGVTVGVAVLILFLVIGILLYRRYKKGRERCKDSEIEEQGSALNKSEENGGAEVKCAVSNMNDSRLEEKSGSSSSSSDGSNFPLISPTKGKSPPVQEINLTAA